MKITKKLREQAALICAISASNKGFADWHSGAAEQIGIERESEPVLLSRAAWNQAWSIEIRIHRNYSANLDAEAEALLRTGWSPEE